jgi:hypothetical protein
MLTKAKVENLEIIDKATKLLFVEYASDSFVV